jgi:hypothetical protein
VFRVTTQSVEREMGGLALSSLQGPGTKVIVVGNRTLIFELLGIGSIVLKLTEYLVCL